MRASGLTPRQPNRVVMPQPPPPSTPAGVISTHIIPSQSNVFNLGSPEFPFKEAFFGKNTIYIGNTPLGVDASGNFTAVNNNGQTAFAGADVTENYAVAVGTDASGETIQWSVDGANWYPASNGVLQSGNAVAWNGSIWVATGTGSNVVVVSTDGHSWSVPPTPPTFIGSGRGLAWNGTSWALAADDRGGPSHRTL